MSVFKKLAGQTAIYGLSSIIGRLLNYLLVPLYTNIFVGAEGRAEYGVSGEFFAYASIGAVIFTYGMETAFFRFMQKNEASQKVFPTILWSIVMSSITLGGLIILLATPLSIWSNNVGREAYFYCLALILMGDAISSLLFAKLRQGNEATRFVKLQLLKIGISIVLNLLFYLVFPFFTSRGLFAPLSTHEPSAIWMFVALVISSLSILFFMSKELMSLKEGFDKVLWKQIIVYGLPILFMGMAGMINETFDRIMIKHLSGDQFLAEQQVGIYNANYKLSIIITLFIQAFRMGAEPFFFNHAQQDDAKLVYARVMKYFMIVCATIFIGVLLYLDIFKYFIGKDYWEGLKIVPVLLMANVFLGAYYNLSVWYKLTDKTALGARVSFAGAAITLILNWLWIPIFGYMGSAWATLVCYFSMAAMSYFLGQKYYPVPYPMRKIVSYLALAMSVYIVSDMLRENLSFPPSVFLLLNTVLFGIYLFVIFKMEEKELRAFISKAS
jgi:O-antigen/teichoic acid export membrane protein